MYKHVRETIRYLEFVWKVLNPFLYYIRNFFTMWRSKNYENSGLIRISYFYVTTKILRANTHPRTPPLDPQLTYNTPSRVYFATIGSELRLPECFRR